MHHRIRSRHARAGMTLIEVMISMVILAVIMIATLTFMTTLAEGAGLVNQITDLEKEGNEIIDLKAESKRTANVQAFATDRNSTRLNTSHYS